MKQLTALENYSKYWVYRAWLKKDSFSSQWWTASATRTPAYKDKSKTSPNIPDPERLSISNWNCIDAGAWYWEAGAAGAHFSSINSFILEGDFSYKAVFDVSKAINGLNSSTKQPNDLPNRLKQTQRISNILADY